MFHQLDVMGYAAVYEFGSWAAMQLLKLPDVGVSGVDDVRLPVENLPEDLLDGLGRIAAHGAPGAEVCGRPELKPGQRVEGVDGADVAAVEVSGVVEEEVDLLELLLLDVEGGVRERVELAGVVPVTVPDDDALDVVGVQPNLTDLMTEVVPA